KPNPVREAALRECGVAFDTAPFAGFWDFVTPSRLRRVAREFRPGVVLAFAGRASSFVPKGDCALIGRLGGYYSLRNFRRCDHLLWKTADLVRYVVEGGWSRKRVHLISNFPFLTNAAPLDRAAFGTPHDAPLAVALGRLHEAKGFDTLLRAAALLP